MVKLERNSPLGASIGARAYANTAAELVEERFLGLAKLIAKGLVDKRGSNVLRALGVSGRLQPNTVVHGDVAVAWLAPDECLLIGAETAVEACAVEAAAAAGGTSLVVPLTHARASFRISGEKSREVLASLAPLDFRADVFAVDACAQTVFGECGVFIQRLAGDNAFRLIFDQSYAGYAWRMLKDACANLVS